MPNFFYELHFYLFGLLAIASALANDCADANPQRNPGRADDCTTTLGTDDDCDVSVDEDAILSVWYRDQDADGFGNVAIAMNAGVVVRTGEGTAAGAANSTAGAASLNGGPPAVRATCTSGS